MDPQFLQTQEDIQSRFDELPQELMDLIVGGTLDAVMFGINDVYKLTPEQATSLENEIILVLSLFVSPSEFVGNVQESLHVERSIADAIGKDVQSGVFDLVEDILTFAESAGTPVPETETVTIDAAAIKKQELSKLAEQFAKPRAVEMTAEEALEIGTENVIPLRTMQGDINRIHGYGAYNDALEAGGGTAQAHVSNQGDILGKGE